MFNDKYPEIDKYLKEMTIEDLNLLRLHIIEAEIRIRKKKVWDKPSLEREYHEILIKHQFASFNKLPESVQKEIQFLSKEYDRLADYCMECGCKATIDCQFH